MRITDAQSGPAPPSDPAPPGATPTTTAGAQPHGDTPLVDTEPMVRLKGLVKHFGDVHALRGVDMDLPRGPVGLLGPNGAGKTTLIGLLLGLLEPTSGQALVAGLSPTTRKARLAIRRRVGYMPESDCLLPGMSGVELVSTLGKLTGLSRQDAMTRAHEVLDYVELEEARYRPLDGYSTGMKQRLKLAQALVHDPDLLLLDEPTNGLDPKGRRHMLSLVEDLGRNQGKNVLLCSHLLPDVEKTCDHVVVLVQGKTVLQGSIANLTAAEATRISIETEQPAVEFQRALIQSGYECAEQVAEHGVQADPRKFTATLPSHLSDADELLAIAAQTGAILRSLAPMRSTLEQVFLRAVDADSAPPGGTPSPSTAHSEEPVQ